MKKFILIRVSGIITSIGHDTDVVGYVEKVIETVFPSDEELAKMTSKENRAWVKANNIRMQAICNFMNNFNVK